MSRARKRFGQNFLVDAGIVGRIVRAIDPQPDQHLLEIGPGRGALTEPLYQSPCRLTTVEIDRDLAAALTARFPDLNVITQDVLSLDVASLQSGQPLRIVGNLPYNISTPLIFHLLRSVSHIQDMHFMLQLEVVDRMCAVPSTRDYGRLTIMTQIHCEVEKLFHVPPEAFTPRPRVQSAIVRLTPRKEKPSVDSRLLQDILIRAFSSRRKTIRNALGAYLDETAFTTLALDPGLRPENLSVEDFIHCARYVAAAR